MFFARNRSRIFVTCCDAGLDEKYEKIVLDVLFFGMLERVFCVDLNGGGCVVGGRVHGISGRVHGIVRAATTNNATATKV